jgi:hypothetical protein
MSNPNARLHNALNDLLREVLRLPSSAFMQIDPDVIDAAHAALTGAKSATVEAEKDEDPYARLKAYNEAGARIRCGFVGRNTDIAWFAHEEWEWIQPVDQYEVHPDDLHLVPAYDPARSNGATPPADKNEKL